MDDKNMKSTENYLDNLLNSMNGRPSESDDAADTPSKTDTSSHGYTCEMLSNSRKSSFFQNYRERQESSLDSRTELFWMVQSFEHNVYVELEKCEVLETPPESCLEGDMNPFLGNTVFPMETRKTLALYFTRKGQKKNFCEDMVRFFVSQIQLSVCEYKCVGILMDSHL